METGRGVGTGPEWSDAWDVNRAALREWGISVGGIIVLAAFELAFMPPLSDPVGEHWVRLIGKLCGFASTFVEGLGHLAAMVALPVTLFIAVALGDSGAFGSRWSRQARGQAAQLLRWSSRVVSVLSWYFIPTLVVSGTVVLGIVVPVGAQILCAYAAAMAVTERTSLLSYDAVTQQLEQAQAWKTNLSRTWARWRTPFPWWRRLTQSLAGFLVAEAIVAALLAIPSVVDCARGAGSAWGLVACGAVILLMLVGQVVVVRYGALAPSTSARETVRALVAGVAAIPFVVLAENALNHTDAIGRMVLSQWVLAPVLLVLIILLTLFFVVRRWQWFIPSRLAVMTHRIRQLQHSQDVVQHIMDAQQV